MTEKRGATPIRKQYLDIKQQHKDAILFFRLGDFYETFDEDAETISRELDIVLTSRTVGKGTRVPMAGIPHHAAENYLGRLISRGYHVAICDQVGTQPINGLMPREVVRVVTPGTIMEDSLLPDDSNNYLVAVIVGEHQGGIAFVDITTGEFSATQVSGKDIRELVRTEITRLHPAELLIPETLSLNNDLPGHQSLIPDWRFEHGRCETILKSQFKVESLDGFGLNSKLFATRAAGAIVQYLGDTQPASLKLLTGVSVYSTNEHMTLDAATRRNLELVETIRDGSIKGSLLGILDFTVTAMGKRLLRRWVSKPLLDIQTINARLDGIDFFYTDGLIRDEFRSLLKPVNDIERLTNRVLGRTAQPRDLVAIRSTLEHLPEVKASLGKIAGGLSGGFKDLKLCEDALRILSSAVEDEPPMVLGNIGIIKQGYSSELDGVYEASKDARNWIANLEKVERERTGIKNLKVGFNKVFGYYIEVTKSHVEQVPGDYIRKQTLVNAERYITPEMKEYEALVLNAEERIKEIERRVFFEVCDQIQDHAGELLGISQVVAKLDVFAALAETAVVNEYVRPDVVSEDVLDIRGSRHPVVEHTLVNERFIPNDAEFESSERVRIITGPNMSGKSTFLRQIALIVLMAQMGSYVPAESATIGLVDRIFTRIGAQDEIHAGKSTFMVEMVETANILNNATSRSLLILDEIGRGTSTYDGVSIAWAMVEYIHNHPKLKAKTLFATHYHELTQLADLYPGVRNYNVAVSEADNKVVFLRKIIQGGADRSYGIHVAQIAGVPSSVIQRANEILMQLEKSSGKAVQIDPHEAQQLNLFPESNPLLGELKDLDLESLTPIEALNRLYEWQHRFIDEEK